MRFAFFLLVLFPITELIVLIKVGSLFGVLPTVALVLCTASLGVYLLRQQGLKTLFLARERMASGQVPAREMMDGIVIAACGALLLAPGFITDIIALTGLFPVTRRKIVCRMLASQRWQAGAFTQAGFYQSDATASGTFDCDTSGRKPETLEGKFRREE